jgi:hypothetical protein
VARFDGMGVVLGVVRLLGTAHRGLNIATI